MAEGGTSRREGKTKGQRACDGALSGGEEKEGYISNVPSGKDGNPAGTMTALAGDGPVPRLQAQYKRGS